MSCCFYHPPHPRPGWRWKRKNGEKPREALTRSGESKMRNTTWSHWTTRASTLNRMTPRSWGPRACLTRLRASMMRWAGCFISVRGPSLYAQCDLDSWKLPLAYGSKTLWDMLILASDLSQTSLPDSVTVNITFTPELLYWFPSLPSWLCLCLLSPSTTVLSVSLKTVPRLHSHNWM